MSTTTVSTLFGLDDYSSDSDDDLSHIATISSTMPTVTDNITATPLISNKDDDSPLEVATRKAIDPCFLQQPPLSPQSLNLRQTMDELLQSLELALCASLSDGNTSISVSDKSENKFAHNNKKFSHMNNQDDKNVETNDISPKNPNILNNDDRTSITPSQELKILQKYILTNHYAQYLLTYGFHPIVAYSLSAYPPHSLPLFIHTHNSPDGKRSVKMQKNIDKNHKKSQKDRQNTESYIIDTNITHLTTEIDFNTPNIGENDSQTPFLVPPAILPPASDSVDITRPPISLIKPRLLRPHDVVLHRCTQAHNPFLSLCNALHNEHGLSQKYNSSNNQNNNGNSQTPIYPQISPFELDDVLKQCHQASHFRTVVSKDRPVKRKNTNFQKFKQSRRRLLDGEDDKSTGNNNVLFVDIYKKLVATDLSHESYTILAVLNTLGKLNYLQLNENDNK